MIQLILYIVLWGAVIAANVDYEPDSAPCNYNLCPYCPFPCEHHAEAGKF